MLLQVNTVKNCIKQSFCVYLWVGDQAAADNHRNLKKKRFCERVSSMTYLLFIYIFFFYMSAEFKPSSILRWGVSSPSVTNACASSAPAPAVFPHAWPRLPFLHPHQATLGYGFSNGRCRTRWRQRRGSRVWTWGGFWVPCPRATDWRTLQDRKEHVSVDHVTSWQPACITAYNKQQIN